MEDNQLNFNQPFLSVRHKEDIKNPNSHISDVKSGHVRNPGSVPFVWEQSPGKRKDENRLQIDHSKRFSRTAPPKLPPGRQESDHSSGFFSQDKDDHDSDSSDDEVYVDALDTLSRTESFFLNCSVSGVSGFEEETKPPGSFDLRAKDFMIGRFLPAAKAMASESPQINTQPKKQQPIVTDQSRQPKKIVNDKKGPQLRYGPSFAKQHAEYYDNRDEESHEDLDESEIILQAKVCGLVPRFFLNRIPARRSVRTTRPSVSSASSWSKTELERSSFDTSGRKSMDGSLIFELHEEKNNSGMKTEHVSQASESKKTSNADLNSLGTGYKTFKDMLLSEKNNSEEVDSEFLEIEKTIYVDSVRKFNNSPQNDQEHDKLDINLSKIHDFKVQDPKLGFSKKRILETENIGGVIIPDFSIPPPLPKSPSDSWLYRTLPLIYSKNTIKTSKTQEMLDSIPEN